MRKKVIELTLPLQWELQKMSEEEFNQFMKNKILKFENVLYGLEDSKACSNCDVECGKCEE